MGRGWCVVRLLAAGFALLFAFAASGQAAPATTSATPATISASAAAPRDEAVVRIFGRTIAVFRAPFLGATPAERARRSERSILELLARGGPGVVTVQKEPQGNVLLLDGVLALFLLPEDADVLHGQDLDAATQAAVTTLSRAVAETKEARDRGHRLRALGFAALGTAIYLFLAWGLWRVRDALSDRIADLLERAAERARVASRPLWEATRIHAAAHWLVRAVSWFLLVVFSYQWLVFVLQLFPRTRAWGEQLGGFVLDLLEQLGEGALDALPDLIVAAVIFLLARGVIGALRPIFDRVERGEAATGWLERDIAAPTRRLVSVAVWLFAIVMAYPYLPGSQSEAFKGMSVLLGLMITIGGSSVIGQAFSGLILMYSRMVRVGEYVRIGEQEGTVMELGLFTTRLRTATGQEVALPNAVVMNSVTSNFSRAAPGPAFLVETGATIGYDTPWREVEAMLLEAARRTPGLLAEPQPWVMRRGLSDFYVDYRLVCQSGAEAPRARAEVLSALHANVLDVFNEHGVQIMSPHFLGDPRKPKLVPPDHPYAAPRRAGAANTVAGAEAPPARAAAAARPPNSP